MGRIDRYGQHITCKGLHLGWNSGEFIGFLGIHLLAFRVDTHGRPGELRRPAFCTLATHHTQEHVSLAPQDGHGRLGGSLCPNTHLRLNQIAEPEEFHVIISSLLIGKGALDPPPLGQITDGVGDLEVHGITPLSESCRQDTISRLRLF